MKNHRSKKDIMFESCFFQGMLNQAVDDHMAPQ